MTPQRPRQPGHPLYVGRASLQAAGEGGVEAEQSDHLQSNLEPRQLSSPSSALPGSPEQRASDSSWSEMSATWGKQGFWGQCVKPG